MNCAVSTYKNLNCQFFQLNTVISKEWSSALFNKKICIYMHFVSHKVFKKWKCLSAKYKNIRSNKESWIKVDLIFIFNSVVLLKRLHNVCKRKIQTFHFEHLHLKLAFLKVDIKHHLLNKIYILFKRITPHKIYELP